MQTLSRVLRHVDVAAATHDGVLKQARRCCRYELEDVPELVLEAATCVTSLSLDSNDLAALPPAIAAFTCLVELLSVCDNRLQAPPAAQPFRRLRPPQAFVGTLSPHSRRCSQKSDFFSNFVHACACRCVRALVRVCPRACDWQELPAELGELVLLQRLCFAGAAPYLSPRLCKSYAHLSVHPIVSQQ